ncbi:glycosyltransferase [Sulfolobus tengchongensis]|uniref:Glycosyltransferase n=1 Tax=Sulfolobus tengchongensis TaxID=207809 RepID=A0AAX4L1B5_9CREN
MEDLKALVIMPPILFSSEAKVAVAFSRVLKEYGFSKQYGIFLEKNGLSDIFKLSPDLAYSLDIIDTKIKLVKGPVISGLIDYIIVKLTKLLKNVNLSVNLYYTEIPLGLDLTYVIYPPSVMFYKDLLYSKYKNLRKLYLSANMRILEKLANSDRLICSSYYIKSIMENTFKYNCSVVYPPVMNIEKYDNVERENLVVGVGKYVEPKHWDEFIQIAKKVRQVNNKIKFKIIGGLNYVKSSRKYFEYLKNIAGDNVELLIDVPESEKWKLFHKAKIILHCMRNDNISLGVEEAMSVGVVPVVYRATGSWIDITKEGKYGFSYSNIDEASNIILELIRDENLYMKMSEASKERAVEFSYDTFKSRLGSILKTIRKE